MASELIDAAFVTQAARGIGLELAPGHVAGVVTYYRMIAGMADAVNGLPLDDAAEHAAIFTPCSPPTQD